MLPYDAAKDEHEEESCRPFLIDNRIQVRMVDSSCQCQVRYNLCESVIIQ